MVVSLGLNDICAGVDHIAAAEEHQHDEKAHQKAETDDFGHGDFL